MKCMQCGMKNTNESLYCVGCGGRIQQAVTAPLGAYFGQVRGSEAVAVNEKRSGSVFLSIAFFVIGALTIFFGVYILETTYTQKNTL
ncbi:MAG: hypothetical protein IJ317_01895 [Clostridia bacterium]|nr:hypothetical protein [Clostridia bacterium]